MGNVSCPSARHQNRCTNLAFLYCRCPLRKSLSSSHLRKWRTGRNERHVMRGDTPKERGRRDRERCVPGSLAAFRRFWSDQNLAACRAHRHEYLRFDHPHRHSLIHPTAAVFAFLLPFVSRVCLECHIHQSFLVNVKPRVFFECQLSYRKWPWRDGVAFD